MRDSKLIRSVAKITVEAGAKWAGGYPFKAVM
jgi:hypothetical protein